MAEVTPALKTPPPLPITPEPAKPPPLPEETTQVPKEEVKEEPAKVEPAKVEEVVEEKTEPSLETKIKMQDQEAKPEKKVIKRKKLGIGCSCRAIGCGTVFIFVALIVGIVILFATRPTWFKEFLNADLVEPVYDGTTSESAYSRITLQFDSFGIGQNELLITEDQTQAILADQFGDTLKVDLAFNNIKIFTDIDGGEVPLWLVMDVEINDDNNPVFTNIGFERVGLPPFLNQVISQVLLSLAGVVTDEGRGFLDSMLNLPNNVTIKDVRVLTDELIVTLEVSTGLDNLFE